jgi:predicted alpha/beta-fold hydrolase
MPLISSDEYSPATLLRWGHANTMYPTLFRKVRGLTHRRERIDTPDDDFLDVDWSYAGETPAARVAIILHGLEGDSKRSYMRGMTRAMNRRGWDVCAMNMRGCSGESNRKIYAYHSGKTDDLDVVVRHVVDHHRYTSIALVGFSLGGNQVLKYLGETGADLDPRIRAGFAASVLVDLGSGSRNLERASNALYMAYFMKMLREKVRDKKARFPGQVDDAGLRWIRTFAEFDGRYTAPWHGFESAEDYWERASCKHWLRDIRVPTYLLNSQDDPFMTPESYPYGAAEDNPEFNLEVSRWGGHVGFVDFNADDEYYSEYRAGTFLNETVPA